MGLSRSKWSRQSHPKGSPANRRRVSAVPTTPVWTDNPTIVVAVAAVVIVAAVVYQITKNSNLSSPIGLSAPLWSVAGVAIALLVRGARKQARRGVDLARIAEEEQYEFALQAAQPVLELLRSISFMQNPTSAKGRNVLSSVDGTVRHFALDYFYAYELPLVQAWLAPVLQQTDLLARTSPEAL